MPRSSAHMRRLGAELRRLRTAAGVNQVDLAETIGRTHASIVNWERGKTRMSKSDLLYLLTELRAAPEVLRDLEELRQDTGRGGIEWAAYNLPAWLRPISSFEEDAERVEAFEPLVVPGLLQTEDYAREMHVVSPFLPVTDDVERGTSARMRRQEHLRRPHPLTLDVVIGEAALRLAVGGPAVMVPQLERLLAAADTATITIRVLPFAAGAHPALAGNFQVLHFADPEIDPPLVAFDGPLVGRLISDRGDVAAMVTVLADLRDRALSIADSRALLSEILTTFRDQKE